jgi:hypothetical protein
MTEYANPARGWLTNNPAIAHKLQAADRRFDRAVKAATALPLAQKIVAMRAAKDQRLLDYQHVAVNA